MERSSVKSPTTIQVVGLISESAWLKDQNRRAAGIDTDHQASVEYNRHHHKNLIIPNEKTCSKKRSHFDKETYYSLSYSARFNATSYIILNSKYSFVNHSQKSGIRLLLPQNC